MTDQQQTRRAFLRGAAVLGGTLLSGSPPLMLSAEEKAPGEIVRQPDVAIAFAGFEQAFPLGRQGDAWTGGGVHVSIEADTGGRELAIRLSSSGTALSHLHLRWALRVPRELRCLGDAWERSYGDLAWRGIVPERVMPWYVLTFDGRRLCGYGVKTQAAALCFWQIDEEGISFWADLRNGGMPVQLGQRQLTVATIVAGAGAPGEDPFAAAQAFCRSLCVAPRLPAGPIYGSNDWYYAYGKNTAEGILRDADLVASLAPSGGARPFVVIDDGWQDAKRFPDLTGLAARIRGRKLRPGIWVRPLRAPRDAHPSLLLPDERLGSSSRHALPAWDPTIPEAMEHVLDAVRQPVSWGYEFIKHDFSTVELAGRWGSAAGALLTEGNWQFADRSKTNAEIILAFYRALREAAGERTTVLGCNTIGHLAAGIFESQRIGDDISGTNWERTRRMGVNALGFRLPQHRTFSCVDPDCVPITEAIEWGLTKQWLNVVARTGTSLFISAAAGTIRADQRAALREAFHAVGQSHGYAKDWLDTTAPREWHFEGSQDGEYDWSGADGASPFPV